MIAQVWSHTTGLSTARVPQQPDIKRLCASGSDAKSMEKSVTSYFDEDGFLARDVIHADATQLLQTFQKRNVKKVN
jgi:hypothetical protein